jgi:uncharacterized protein (TIGR02246 family)
MIVLRVACQFILIAIIASIAAWPAHASDAAVEIENALKQWRADFNAGRADKVCGLFAPDLRADFRGQPERGYDALCDLLKRSLSDKEKTFSYGLDVKEILVFGDVAVVRLDWTLTVKDNDGRVSASVEPGMDIFQKQVDGTWRIVRYMAYEN